MVAITLTAEGMAFDTKEITVPAGSPVEMTFENRDTGVPHNFALYRDSSAAEKFFAGEVITGPKAVTYTFTAPSGKGRFFFRCDVHPKMMTGAFVTT
ncbi:MAG: plastocyanin/azurin family copper-binding protein [Methanospirillum sp.]